jgi:moderate conductance mechanosensitive channel
VVRDPDTEPAAVKKIFDMYDTQELGYLLNVLDAAWRVALVLLLAWLAWIISSRLIGMARTRLAARATDPDYAKQIATMTHVFRYIAGVVISIVAVMLVLGELGITIAPILATAGVAGIAIGFGVQSLVKDYFTGFVLLFENQIRNGDVVEAGGKAGLVEEVTLRYVRMRDYHGVVHFIPNGLISSVSNMSMGYAFAVVDAGIAYRSDIDTAIRVMKEQAAGMRTDPTFAPKILDDLDVAGVEKWDDSAVILRVRFKTLPLEQWNVRREYLRRLKAAFDTNGIEIPYPHLTVYAGEAGSRAPFPVQLLERPSAEPARPA